MNIDTTITIDTALNTGLALLGWFYIMFSAGKWAASVFLKQWGKRRKQENARKRWRRSMTHLNLAALSQAQQPR